MSLSELIQLYTDWQRSLGRSPAQFVQLRLAFRNLVEQVPGEDVQALTARQLATFQAWLQQQPLSPGTIYRRWRIVFSLLQWAVKRQFLLHNPGLGLEMAKPEQELPRFVPSQRQLQQLLECPSPYTLLGQRDRFILELFYGTGLRRREVARLDLDDISREARALRVRQGKGGKDRLVPLGDHLISRWEHYLREVRPALRPQAQEKALLIDSQGGRRLCHASLRNRLQRYTRKLRLTACTLHSIRHAYALHLLQNGADIEQIRCLLGHRQVTTTQTYLQILPEELMRIYRSTHPRARRRCQPGKNS